MAQAFGWFGLGIAVFGAWVIHDYQILERIRVDYGGRDFTMGERVLTQFRVVLFHMSVDSPIAFPAFAPPRIR